MARNVRRANELAAGGRFRVRGFRPPADGTSGHRPDTGAPTTARGGRNRLGFTVKKDGPRAMRGP